MTDCETDATKNGGQEKSDVHSPPKAQEAMSTSSELPDAPCLMMADFENRMSFGDGLGQEFLIWLKDEKGVMSYWGMRLLIWLFALDQPVGKSTRALLAMRVVIQYALWVLTWRRLKATIQNMFSGMRL